MWDLTCSNFLPEGKFFFFLIEKVDYSRDITYKTYLRNLQLYRNSTTHALSWNSNDINGLISYFNEIINTVNKYI